MENKKCVIYSRISTNKEKQNVQQQIEYCKDYAKRNDLEVVKIFKDEQTGKTKDRKGYKKLLSFIEENTSIIILVLDTDRLTRNFYDGVELERFLIKNKIKLVSTSENIDFQTPNGRLMYRIKIALNSHYVENLLKKQKIGIERAKKEGKFKGRPKGTKNKKKYKRNRKKISKKNVMEKEMEFFVRKKGCKKRKKVSFLARRN
jgi:DNA invertase Pin-like site-specific DNA recombinase